MSRMATIDAFLGSKKTLQISFILASILAFLGRKAKSFYTLRYRLGLWIQCVQYMSKSMILAVRRTHVKHKPCIWPSSPQVQRSSVVRASDRCTVGHIGSINVGDSDFFFVLCSWDVDHRSHFFAALHQETSIFNPLTPERAFRRASK